MASARGFTTGFRDLPDALPVFPLDAVLLLPGGKLPLNIFEPRYIRMVDDALASERLIGMIQPDPDDRDHPVTRLCTTGCVGRLVSFAETGDHRYLITLTGVIRFDVGSELPGRYGYRRVVPDFAPYLVDLDDEPAGSFDRAGLLAALQAFLAKKGIKADWRAIEELGDTELVTSLAMSCPLDAREKQALLTASDTATRAGVLIAMLEMAVLSSTEPGDARH